MAAQARLGSLSGGSALETEEAEDVDRDAVDAQLPSR